MKISHLFLSTVFAFSLTSIGCKSGDDAKAEKMISIMESLGKAVESASGDCTKMAANVDGVFKSNEAELKELKAWGESMKNDKAKAEELKKKYSARMEKVMPQMMGMMKCAEDPKMKESMEKLKGMM
jgi:hypothetical protein